MTDRELDDLESGAEQNAWDVLLMFCAHHVCRTFFFFSLEQFNEAKCFICVRERLQK